MAIFNYFRRIIFPLILCVWLIFEIIKFFRLGGGGQPLAWCFVKISVITSSIRGLSSERFDEYIINSVNYEFLIDTIKTQSLDKK